MKNLLLAATLVFAMTAVAIATRAKHLATDHTHPELKSDRTGIFDISHSGGLDQNGGHYDRSTGVYHFHR